jgi:hypothetical protein
LRERFAAHHLFRGIWQIVREHRTGSDPGLLSPDGRRARSRRGLLPLCTGASSEAQCAAEEYLDGPGRTASPRVARETGERTLDAI